MAVVRWAGLWLVVLGALLSPRLFERHDPSLWEVRQALAQEASPTHEVPANPTPDSGTATETATAEATPTQDATVTETATEIATPVPDTETAIPPTETPAESATAPLETETPTPTETPSVTPTPSPTATSTAVVEVIIGPDGGSVTTADGNATLTFPAGATDEPLLIRVETVLYPDDTPVAYPNLLGYWDVDAYAIDRAYAPVHTFAFPVQLDTWYSAERLFGLRDDVLRVWLRDDAGTQLEELPVELTGANEWRAQLPHFSHIIAGSDSVLSIPPVLDQAQVDLATGAATFSYPIPVPVGIGFVAPTLSVDYSSTRVDEAYKLPSYNNAGENHFTAGWLGMGWDLSVPSITRAAGTPNRYFLNMAGHGGELVPTATGEYRLRANAASLTVVRTGSQYCGDSTSETVFQDAYDCSWVVTDQSGTVYAFGSTANSRRFYHGWNGYTHYQWDLRTVKDVHGNTATYEYQQVLGRVLAGNPLQVLSSYPSSITYPGGRLQFTTIAETVTNSNWVTADGSPLPVRPDLLPSSPCSSAEGALETRRLDVITVEAWDAGWVPVSSYDFDVSVDNAVSCFQRVRLAKLDVKGRDNGTLYSPSFLYESRTTRRDCSTNPKDGLYLSTANNGFGASATFSYSEKCKSGFRSRHVVNSVTVNAGSSWSASAPNMIETYAYDGEMQFVPDPEHDGPAQYRGFTKVTVTDASSDKVQHYFKVGNEASTNAAFQLAGREWKTELLNASNVLHRRLEHSWAAVAASPSTTFNVRLNTTTETLKDATTNTTSYTYDPITGRVASVTTGSGAACRKSTTTYYVEGSIVVPNTEEILPCTPATATPVASTAYFYDGTSGGPRAGVAGRGNVTAVRHLTRTDALSPGEDRYVWTLSSYLPNGMPSAQNVPVYGGPSLPQGSGDALGRVDTSRGYTKTVYDELSEYPYSTSNPPADPTLYGRLPKTVTEYVFLGTSLISTQTTAVTFDGALGKPTLTTLPNGMQSGAVYDEFGRTLKLWRSPESAGTAGTEYSYTWNGWSNGSNSGSNITAEKHRLTLGGSLVTTANHCLDGMGRELQTNTGTGNAYQRKSVKLDAEGRISNTVVGAHAFVCMPGSQLFGGAPNNYQEYDTSGEVWRTTNSAAGTPASCSPSCIEVQRNGRTTTIIDQNLHKKDSTVDALGRVIQTRDYIGNSAGTYAVYSTVTYTYDLMDNLLTVTDNTAGVTPSSAVNVTAMTYDALGRKRTMDDPDMSGGNVPWQYRYDAANNLTYQRDARGVETVMTYDSANRLRTKSYVVNSSGVSPQGAVTFTYDQYDSDPLCSGQTATTAVGRMTVMSDDTGVTRWCYNIRGNEVAKKRTITDTPGLCGSPAPTRSFTITRTYDTADRLVDLAYPDGEVVSNVYRDTSAGGGRFDSLVQKTGGVVTYTYVGPVSYHIAGGMASVPLGNGFTTSYAYDSRYRLSGISTGNGTTTPQALAYEYFENGNIRRINDTAANDDAWYSYDDLDRLIEMRRGVGGAPGASPSDVLAWYEYADGGPGNKAGGRIGNMSRKVEGPSDITFEHNDADHVHAPSKAGDYVMGYDANGNMMSYVGSGDSEQYTFDIESRLTSRKQILGFGLQTDYRYNGAGDLVHRRVSSWQYPGLIDTKTWYVDGLFEERSSACGTPNGTTKFYMALGRIIAERNGTSLKYLLADHLGSTSTSIDAASGFTVQVKYWPFGGTRSGAEPTDKAHTQQQKEANSLNGAYYYKARFYSTTLGRFMSADSLVPDGPGHAPLNRYASAFANPLVYRDPSGHVPCTSCSPHYDSEEGKNVHEFDWRASELGLYRLPVAFGVAVFGDSKGIYLFGTRDITWVLGGVTVTLLAGNYVLRFDAASILDGSVDVQNSAGAAVPVMNPEAMVRIDGVAMTAATALGYLLYAWNGTYAHYTTDGGAAAIMSQGRLMAGPDDPGGRKVYYTRKAYVSGETARRELALDKVPTVAIVFRTFVPAESAGPVRDPSTGQLTGGYEYEGRSPLPILPVFGVRLLP